MHWTSPKVLERMLEPGTSSPNSTAETDVKEHVEPAISVTAKRDFQGWTRDERSRKFRNYEI
jgi:hypothetical protein